MKASKTNPAMDGGNSKTDSTAYDSSGNTFIGFPTIYFHKKRKGAEINKMNSELKNLALKIENESKSDTTSSIVGGHHSDRQLFERDNWALKQLKQLILEDFSGYFKKYWSQECTTDLAKLGLKEFQVKMTGWTMIMREGDMSAPHLHHHSNISGTYYVSAPEISGDNEAQSGNLVICDPRIRSCLGPLVHQCTSIRIPPQPGAIVMFPSYIEHYVLPFKGKGERISIAFNIYFPRELGGLDIID